MKHEKIPNDTTVYDRIPNDTTVYENEPGIGESKRVSIELYLLDMPESVRGAVTPTGNGYIIAINDKLSNPQKAATIAHEVLHILNDDFHDEKGNARDIERRTMEMMQDVYSLLYDDFNSANE